MPVLMVFADAVPTDVAVVLDSNGYQWKAVASVESAIGLTPEDGWLGGLVLVDDFERALDLCRTMRRQEPRVAPLLFGVHPEQVQDLGVVDDTFDDFIKLPVDPDELEVRLNHVVWRTRGGARPEVVEYGGLVLNLANYQAAVAGRPLDMTYMEYELLKHFVTNPDKVHTREQLLRQVWGYEYYGGARTVDVHVRRLRAKLGEEHAQLIQTVRSVGYIFGRSRWTG